LYRNLSRLILRPKFALPPEISGTPLEPENHIRTYSLRVDFFSGVFPHGFLHHWRR
jgi:hypothetical protein